MINQKRPHQPPLLATVTQLPALTPEQQTTDLQHTLQAVGITVSREQARVLANAGMHGLQCWTPSNHLSDVTAAVQRTRELEHALALETFTKQARKH